MIEGHFVTLTTFCQSSFVPYSSSYDVFQWNHFFQKKKASSQMYNCIILHDIAQMWSNLRAVPGPALKKKGRKDEILAHDPGLTPQSVQVHGLGLRVGISILRYLAQYLP